MKIDGKKIKSTIISKTAIFLFVMAFVIIFRSVFGEENTILGVTTLILTLSLLQRDLTKKPLNTLVNLIVFNLLLGLAAFLVSANLWLGLIANFIAMASIGYIFNYELNNPMNMLFGLHYILLMTSTIQSSQIPMRIVALIIGPCIIMAAQLLANKNKLVKSSKKIIDIIEVNLITKINLLIDELSKKDTKLIVILEDILCDIKENKFISKEVENKILLYRDNSVDLLEIYEIINTSEVLIKEMKTIKELSDEEKNNIDEMIQIPFEFTNKGYHKKSLNINSNRVAYAIRLGLLVSTTTFITKYYNLEYGKWMIYTVFALTQPYEEFTKIKSIKRIIGTVIGALIVMILFDVTKGPTPKMIAMLVSGYLMSYVSDYKYTMILSTICVLSSAGASMSNPNVVVFNRIGFVIIGIVISLLASKIILNRKYEDEENKLKSLQKDITSRLIEELMTNESVNNHNIANLVLMPTMIEKRVNSAKLNIEKDAIDMYKYVANEIYQIHLISDKKYNDSINIVKNIMSETQHIENIHLNITEYIENIEDIREKTLINSILKIIRYTNHENEENKVEDLVLVM